MSFLIFPELSLTGYELDSLTDLVIGPRHEALLDLRFFSQQARMTLVVGAPIATKHGKPAIGAICLFPDGTTTTYCKRFLHAGEQAFAVPGEEKAHRLDLNGERVCIAICADTSHADHPRWAHEAGATVYAAGVLWSYAGYDTDAAQMQTYCAKHGFAGLVANHSAPTGGYQSAGRSAFWDSSGKLLCAAPTGERSLLIARKDQHAWSCIASSVDC